MVVVSSILTTLFFLFASAGNFLFLNHLLSNFFGNTSHLSAAYAIISKILTRLTIGLELKVNAIKSRKNKTRINVVLLYDSSFL